MNTLFSSNTTTARERMATLERLFPAHGVREPRRAAIAPATSQAPAPAPQPAAVRPAAADVVVGSAVKVNHYRGTVRNVITHVESLDRAAGVVRRLPLANPLYEIEIDFGARYRWVDSALQVFIPQGCKRLRLFSDEFQPMREDEQPLRERGSVKA